MRRYLKAWTALAAAAGLFAQPVPPGKKPYRTQSPSSLAYTVKDGEEVVEIANVAYEVTGPGIPGRPREERLVLRKTVRSRQVLGDIGMESTSLVEAWPLGVDPAQKPLYSLTMSGADAQTVNGEVLVISRGLEEMEWWSVHSLGDARHLFDTYVPMLQFSIAREIQTLRYAGLEVPPDDASDVRLKAPNVVAVLTYASAERVIREALLTCGDPQQARLLRSYADSTRTLAAVEGEPVSALRITIRQSYPSPPGTLSITVPIVNDDLDLIHSQAPGKLRLTAWKR